MLRRRDIAASPARRADEAWTTIVNLVADTLDRSEHIDRGDVVAALDVAATVGPRLVAARHLEKHPIVLIAEPVRLSIYTVSGAEAITLEENLSPVPGGTSATTWKLHLPAPDPLTTDITAAITGSEHVTVDEPPSSSVKSAAAEDLIDLDALAGRFSEEGA